MRIRTLRRRGHDQVSLRRSAQLHSLEHRRTQCHRAGALLNVMGWLGMRLTLWLVARLPLRGLGNRPRHPSDETIRPPNERVDNGTDLGMARMRIGMTPSAGSLSCPR